MTDFRAETDKPIFISYSHANTTFARKLYTDSVNHRFGEKIDKVGHPVKV
jgi:hypothetical protein